MIYHQFSFQLCNCRMLAVVRILQIPSIHLEAVKHYSDIGFTSYI